MKLYEALIAFLLSAVKLLFAPLGYVLANAFPLLEIAVICAFGGTTGALVFFYVGKGLNKLEASKKVKKNKSSKVFTTKNKQIIKIKNQFGVYGMAMTIGLISVPLGSILVGKYFGKNKLAIPALIGAAFIWSFGITYGTALFTRFLFPLFS